MTGSEHHKHTQHTTHNTQHTTHNTQHTKHNTQKQDEPLPPYPQQLCPISPWQHLPWPQIMVPRLLTSLLQAPGSGLALTTAGSLGWDAKLICIKNRERDGSLALGGRHLVIRHNNQPIVGGSNGMDDGEDGWPGWSILGGVILFQGGKSNVEKNYKNKLQQRP